MYADDMSNQCNVIIKIYEEAREVQVKGGYDRMTENEDYAQMITTLLPSRVKI